MSKSTDNCHICGTVESRDLGRPEISPKAAPFIKLDYRVLECLGCHACRVSPTIAFGANEWEQLYDGEYFGKGTRWWTRKRARDRRDRLNRLQDACPRQIADFLDVGCGEGHVLAEAANRGWKAHGIDISDNRAESARENGTLFTKADIFKAGFPDDSFDCVYMDSVLEHVVDPVPYLSELNRIMRTDGVLYVGVPNEGCLFNDVKKLLLVMRGKQDVSACLKPFALPYHVSGFTENSLVAAGKRSGLGVLECRGFGGPYEVLKFRLFSRPFLINLFLLPIHLVAVALKRPIYLDAIFHKKNGRPAPGPAVAHGGPSHEREVDAK